MKNLNDMADNARLQTQISQMERKLAETKDAAEWTAGPVRDVLRIVIPMMEDQLAITREVYLRTLGNVT